MHLLATEAGGVARAVLETLAGPPQGDAASRLREAMVDRFSAERDRTALDALALFEQDPEDYRVPLLVVLANKANQDAGFRARLRELLSDAG